MNIIFTVLIVIMTIGAPIEIGLKTEVPIVFSTQVTEFPNKEQAINYYNYQKGNTGQMNPLSGQVVISVGLDSLQIGD